MEWLEANPIPEECINCTEEDCCNFVLAPSDCAPLREKDPDLTFFGIASIITAII